MNQILKFSFLLCILCVIDVESSLKSSDVTYLEPGKDRVIFKPDKQRNGFGFPPAPVLRIYCFKGRDKNLLNVFNTITFHIDIDDDDFRQYGISDNPEQIIEDHLNEKSLFSFNFLSRNKKRVLKFNPYNTSCIGIESSSDYKVYLQFVRIDFWRVALVIIGVTFIISANTLSQNSLFFYLCGILLGVFASFLFLFYLLHKLIPKKTFMYGTVLTGGSLALYFGQLIIDNIQPILVTYQTFVFWYVVITGCVSFIICYRLGPPENPRNKDLICWSLQVIGFFCVFFSSYFQEATLGINLISLTYYYFPRKWLLKVRSIWRRRFPPKPKLLTNEEFYHQGVVETTKALEELKAYCSSPDCKQWKVMLKLKDPSRFASFIEGDPHVTNDEMMDYETTVADLNMSDDETNSENSDSEVEYVPNASTQNYQSSYHHFTRRVTNSTPQNVPSTSQRRSSRSRTPTIQTLNLRNTIARSTPTMVNGRSRAQNGVRNISDFDLSEDD